MVVKMFMPVACPDKIDALKKYGRIKHPKEEVEVVAVYRKMIPRTLERQNIVFIANTAPKLITVLDKIYILVVDNPLLMAMLCSRVTERMTKLFTRKQRRWYLLNYNPKTKSFDEYFLP